jgi:HSP20 family protein
MNTIVKKNTNFFPAIPSLLEEFLNADWRDSLTSWKANAATIPSVNVSETDDALVIEMAAPGMRREAFKVELENETLTISSEHSESREDNERSTNYIRKEFTFNSFQRSFAVPSGKVKANEITAKYRDGILRVVVPKSEEFKRKPAKQISIG